MSYEETRDIIRRMLNENRSNKFIRDKNLFKKVVSGVCKQIDNLMNENDVNENEDLKNDVARTLNYLIDIAEERPHTDYLECFIDNYTKLIYNWNKRLGNEDIGSKMNYIKRVMNKNTTIQESLSLMRKLNDKLRKYEGYTPESLELSRHYLKTLDENVK